MKHLDNNASFEKDLDKRLGEYFAWKGEAPWHDPTDNYVRMKQAILTAHQAAVKEAYQRGRIDEAKTCEKAGRHDYSQALIEEKKQHDKELIGLITDTIELLRTLTPARPEDLDQSQWYGLVDGIIAATTELENGMAGLSKGGK